VYIYIYVCIYIYVEGERVILRQTRLKRVVALHHVAISLLSRETKHDHI
jgi:hypothetical protein